MTRTREERIEHFEQLEQLLNALISELAPIWPEKDLKHAKLFNDHVEPADALECLIVVGIENNHGFTPDQKKQIEVLATAMKMENSPLLVEFRQRA
jgi:hypothetical protein